MGIRCAVDWLKRKFTNKLNVEGENLEGEMEEFLALETY